MKWGENIDRFIESANKYQVKMILIGGGAVNFHGYQRHSADVDFWIDTDEDNMKKLVKVFKELGYEIDKFPEKVIHQMQNISVKFSPYDLDLELITRFSVGKTFEEAYQDSVEEIMKGEKTLRWKVLNYDDLIISKLKSSRPRDIADVQELKLIQNKN